MTKIPHSIWFVAFVLTGVVGSVTLVSAVDEACLYVDPSGIEDVTLTPPKTFSVRILVAKVIDLRTLEFNMSFDSGILGYRGHSVGALEYSPKSRLWVDDDLGFIWFNITYGQPITSFLPMALANVTFYVRALGETLIDLHDSSLVNSIGEAIPHALSDGFFRNLNPYDLNADLKIDVRDLAVAAKAFGSYPGHPRWNPNADVNKDNKVDIKDIGLIAAHFGQY